MAVAFVKQATAQSAAASTTLTCTLASAPTSGNLLVFCMAGDKNTGALTLTGFTQVFELLSTSVSLYFYWKVSDGTETSVSPSWATSSASGNTAWYAEYDDAAVTGSTWQVSGSASNITDELTTASKATGTTGATSADGMGIAAAAIDSSQSWTSATTWTNSYVERYSATGFGGRGAIFVAEHAETAGATASSTFGYTGTADQVSAAIAVFTKTGAAADTPPTVQPDFMRGAFPFLPMTAWRQSGPTGRPGKPRSMHGPSPAGGFDRFLFPRLHPVFAAGDFLLNADPDTYAVSGLDAGTIADRLANADPGTYAVTGTDAQTVADRTVGANTGSYTITGSSADLLADRLVAAAPGVYTISGVAADLVYVPVVGAFVLNANSGSYTTTGIVADPLATRLLNADPGAHSISGTAATVGAGRVTAANTGSYSTAGVAAGTVAVRMISADTGSYTVGGATASLVYSGAPAPTVRPAEDFTPVFVTL